MHVAPAPPLEPQGTALTVPAEPLTVLVLDDSPAQRNLVCALLRKWGHKAVSTGDPFEALDHARNPEISLILCDWMMPNMTGPEFCRRLRADLTNPYAYVLLLTSRNERNALAEGLEAGADDFLQKPVSPPELRARMNAGARIVAMQRELQRKNLSLTGALAELRSLYGAIDRDLDEARRLQLALVQDRRRSFNGAEVSLMLEPSGHVGGDMVGHFAVDDDVIGLFSLDVSGHGVASAMIAARVAGVLSEASPDQNISLLRSLDGNLVDLPPDIAVGRLNELMLKEVQTDRYFTIALAFANLSTGLVRMVQAGHPHPMVQRAHGRVELVGDGDMPVGLLPDTLYRSFEVQLHPGDRLLLYSDGLTECPRPDGAMLEDAGLIAMMERHPVSEGADLLETLRAELGSFAGQEEFPDDISALLLEFNGR